MEVVTEHADLTAITLRVTGELDLVTTPRLEKSIIVALGHRPAVLVIDLTGVTFLGSSAISALVIAHKASADTTAVRVVAASRETLRPLQLAGLELTLAIFSTRQEASGP
jgi:anti-anti-sigma factor